MDDSLTRAVVATAFGGPEVLALIETPVGPPGPGEVLISVRAAGTNPVQSDKLSTGASPPSEFVRLWTLSARLGFSF